jgi:hypothetical protein
MALIAHCTQITAQLGNSIWEGAGYDKRVINFAISNSLWPSHACAKGHPPFTIGGKFGKDFFRVDFNFSQIMKGGMNLSNVLCISLARGASGDWEKSRGGSKKALGVSR